MVLDGCKMVLIALSGLRLLLLNDKLNYAIVWIQNGIYSGICLMLLIIIKLWHLVQNVDGLVSVYRWMRRRHRLTISRLGRRYCKSSGSNLVEIGPGPGCVKYKKKGICAALGYGLIIMMAIFIVFFYCFLGRASSHRAVHRHTSGYNAVLPGVVSRVGASDPSGGQPRGASSDYVYLRRLGPVHCFQG